MNPQNPYKSFMVSASAGCGKTYQLSQRFLRLVATGAPPSSIVTVTFTKKAAAEMRERIVKDASLLLSSASMQSSFDASMKEFYQDASRSMLPPISALATAKIILSSTQQLNITTIDSLFFSWLQRYATEGLGLDELPKAQLRLAERQDLATLHDQSWNRLCVDWESIRLDESHAHTLNDWIDQCGYMNLRHRIEQLLQHDSFLWLMEQQATAYASYDVPSCGDMTELYRQLRQVASSLSPAFQNRLDKLRATQLTIEDFVEAGVFTRDLCVSKIFLKKADPQIREQCDQLSEMACRIYNNQKLQKLNNDGEAIFRFGMALAEIFRKAKIARSQVDFSDLSKAAYRLFSDERCIGVRYLIQSQICHLLIDEFQDTSRLQWDIFRQLSEELLAGEGSHFQGIPRSVFFVGDDKQSIYGFREADPKIMGEVCDHLIEVEQIIMSDSYRSTPSLMSFVNHLFAGEMQDFPPHTAAGKDHPVIPDSGMIGVLSAVDYGPSMVEDEARQVAEVISYCLEHANEFPVFSKSTRDYRPLQASDCAVLYRFGKHSEVFAAALEERGVPIKREESQGFFARPEIVDTVALIRSVAYPHDLHSLLTLLKGIWIGLTDDDIIPVLQQNQDHSAGLEAELARTHESVAEISSLLHAARNGLGPSLLLQQLLTAERLSSLAMRLGHKELEQSTANIEELIAMVIDFSRQGTPTYAELAQHLAELEDRDEHGNATCSANVVSLMTMHKSKGLEFPLVVLVATAVSWEKQDRYWTKVPGEGIYYLGSKDDQPLRDFAFDAINHRNQEELATESMRLLYVGVTRAKQYLFVSGHRPRHVDDVSFHDRMSVAAQRLGAVSGELPFSGYTFDYRKPFRLKEEQASTPPPPQWYHVDRPWLADSVLTLQSEAVVKEKTMAPTAVSRPFASAFGSIVHALLEHFIKEGTLELNAYARRSLIEAYAIHREFEELYAEAVKQCESVTQSDVWGKMLEGAEELKTEVAIASIDAEQRLVRERLDLVIVKASETWIVDYKSATELQDYSEQLGRYRQRWSAIDPSRKLRSFVLSTSNVELIEVT